MERTITDILELAERVEALDGPCREVDALIEVQRRRNMAYACGLNDKTRAHWEADEKGNVSSQGTSYAAAPFTASLDAAMTLVPEGWVATLTVYGDGCCARLSDDRVNPYRHPDIALKASTPALALTAAALRAGETK